MSDLDTILCPATIRARTRKLYDLALKGGTAFSVQPEKLGDVVDFVLEVTKKNYPDGRVPYHGRYEHLRAGGVDRVARVEQKLGSVDSVERARSLIDLVVVSVLLDAGAGNDWKYDEAGVAYTRSEGLAVASVAMFLDGAFSDDKNKPYQVTAKGLERLKVTDISMGFQVSDSNPLAGLEGRSSLLVRLADSLRQFPEFFGKENPRPGNLIDMLSAGGKKEIRANDILRALLIGLSKMWPARATVEGVGFGDVWPYHGQGFGDLVPFHKLSQWLTYSLIEPIESVGIKVGGVEELTGLPEYRNGGLFLDFGVLKLRDERVASRQLEASDPIIIEWRALTVQLLDEVGERVCKKMGKTKADMPLARVLQGGTWSAGREIAKKLRRGGVPPLNLKSDGMVF